jgi:hypothetical protein
MVNTITGAPAADRSMKSTTGNKQWRRPSWQLAFIPRTAVGAGFLAMCGGLLAVIALRGYAIYG